VTGLACLILDTDAQKRYSVGIIMTKIEIDYEALSRLDTEAFVEFEGELRRKMEREKQESKGSGKKKRRG